MHVRPRPPPRTHPPGLSTEPQPLGHVPGPHTKQVTLTWPPSRVSRTAITSQSCAPRALLADGPPVQASESRARVLLHTPRGGTRTTGLVWSTRLARRLSWVWGPHTASLGLQLGCKEGRTQPGASRAKASSLRCHQRRTPCGGDHHPEQGWPHRHQS